MARSQDTFNKRELEKKRLQKRKEKEQKKSERKANAKEGQTLDDMIAYVDENGNITSTPPDPARKKSIRTEDIVIGSRNNESHAAAGLRQGTVTFFNEEKGYGFIRDLVSGESVFVHGTNLTQPIKENNKVSFETVRGVKGMNAVNVKLIS